MSFQICMIYFLLWNTKHCTPLTFILFQYSTTECKGSFTPRIITKDKDTYNSNYISIHIIRRYYSVYFNHTLQSLAPLNAQAL